MSKRTIREAKTQSINLSISTTETDDATGQVVSSTSQNYTAQNGSELKRLLKLAGLLGDVSDDMQDEPKGNTGSQPGAIMGIDSAPAKVDVTDRLGEHPEGCQCDACCDEHPEGCKCSECCSEISEGRNDLPPGFHDFEAGSMEDTVDLDFDTADRELEEGSEETYDYGHARRGRGDHYDLTAYSYDHGRAATTGIRYTPARQGDNPMASDMREDDGDAEDTAYNDAINAAVDQFRGNPRLLDVLAGDIADEFGRDEMEVRQEIVDQNEALGGGEDDYVPMGESRQTRRSKVEESIAMLAENESDSFLTAIQKVRDGLFESLNAAEVSNLAAAFINLMQNPDTDRVSATHKAFRKYLREAAMLREYQRHQSRSR